MSAGHENRDDRLDENVAKLLSRTPPERVLPQEAKQRILSALIARTDTLGTAQAESTRGATIWNRPVSWVAAAAALFAIALWILRPGGMRSSPAWADVARHFAEVRTVIVWATIEATPPAAGTQVTRARLLQKDPGLSRTEIFSNALPAPRPGDTVAEESIESIVIMSRSAERSTLDHLFPGERRAQRTTLHSSGSGSREREKMPRDLVAESWARLRGLAQDRTRVVGERKIGGVRAIGFAASMSELLGKGPLPVPEGTVRVWAALETALPLEVEVEFSDPGGTAYHTTYAPIEWNPTLPDELFRVPDLDGWQVMAEEIRQVWFSRTSFQDGVTLEIGPADGPPVMTERDVAAVLFARTILPLGAEAPRMSIFLSPTLDGALRIRSYTQEHLGDSLIVDFNEEVRFEIRIGGVMSREIQIDLTALGLTPEEFEERYLAN
jgi:hypothetical protein